ncbi:hypothetical protein PUNSTDRAFT_62137 [Punctularia strigosozonata HHB-11173 SS5]|uniref:uncharacterized protein n=1 Tax=Punctularia strigosozonata (strain HHB-11173) TaxID=741275 RepID=UPI00044169F3|nr:uncharacterized protein PUNSTDRAFT_62137 [Punctularia strigosozonata HHB-11173 SS5]EIN11556.1 hypothetical protein PUNSTDRAFT_62137 [Punctularia strigosozonata HHB-11173 SS5]
MTESNHHTAALNTTALQRGKACLRCRSRKMRCDGTKPACQQCLRSKKGDLCEYDDGKGKTRTQLLREHIARLEQRIRELEDPEHAAPAVTLYDPHASFYDESSASAGSSPASLPAMPHVMPGMFPVPGPSRAGPDHALFQGSPSPIPGQETFKMEEPTEPPIALAQILLDIFLPHAGSQLGFEISKDRLRESLTLPPAEQRHPALMHAIYLWSCFFSRPGPLSEHEQLYLRRTIALLPDALADAARAIDAIQASCLLALYFFTTGRLLEGRYYSSAGAALAIQVGLHQPLRVDSPAWDPFCPAPLERPKDNVDEGERVLAFWQVYNLDRCWSVALGTASTIPRDIDPSFSIGIPWPQSVEEYEAGQMPELSGSDTVRAFLTGQATYFGGYSMPALRAKASALFAYAHRLSSSLDASAGTVDSKRPLQQQFFGFEGLVSRFIGTLLPPNQLDAAVPEMKHTLITAHSLAQTSLIRLLFRFDEASPVAHEKCLRAARACVGMMRHLAESEYAFLDPILASCGLSAAEVLIREAQIQERTWGLGNATEVRTEINLIAYATSLLGQTFPIASASTAGRHADPTPCASVLTR